MTNHFTHPYALPGKTFYDLLVVLLCQHVLHVDIYYGHVYLDHMQMYFRVLSFLAVGEFFVDVHLPDNLDDDILQLELGKKLSDLFMGDLDCR